MNRVTFTLSGREFNILTEESDSYVQQLSAQLNERVSSFMEQHKDISLTEAYMLTAFSMADDSFKTTSDKDNLRRQVIEALEEATKLRAATAKLKQENEAMTRELEALKEARENEDSLEGQTHF